MTTGDQSANRTTLGRSVSVPPVVDKVADLLANSTVDPQALSAFADDINAFVDSHTHELVAFRRRIHAHPELSGQEVLTTESLVSRLDVAGLTTTILASGTGLICDIDSVNGKGPIVALRADIDALAMNDESNTPYASTKPGVAHACGHDVHATVVLGAGLLLARLLQRPDAPAGTVRLIFEPSEEDIPGGAIEVIDSGYLTNVDRVFGLHCDPKINVGLLGVTSGPITSAADLVTLDITGPGGHTARPERTVDLVAVMARAATEIPRMLVEATPDSPLRLVFGSVHSGDAPNVVPARGRLFGTLRTKDHDVWDKAPKLLEDAVERVLTSTGATWSIIHQRGVPPVINDEAATSCMAGATAALLGTDTLTATDQSWGGDTFAWYLEEKPGSYARLGTHDPDSATLPLDLHASTFDVDESAIPLAVRVLVATALSTLLESDD